MTTHGMPASRYSLKQSGRESSEAVLGLRFDCGYPRCDSWDGAVFTSYLVDDGVGLALVRDGTDQAVLCNTRHVQPMHALTLRSIPGLTGDVLEVTSVLEPWTTSGDVVGGWRVEEYISHFINVLLEAVLLTALANGLDQNGSLNDVLAIPWLERLKELQSVGSWGNHDLDGTAVLRRSLEGILSWVVTLGWELETSWVRELELLAVGSGKRVGQGVESEVTGEGHGGDKLIKGKARGHQQNEYHADPEENKKEGGGRGG